MDPYESRQIYDPAKPKSTSEPTKPLTFGPGIPKEGCCVTQEDLSRQDLTAQNFYPERQGDTVVFKPLSDQPHVFIPTRALHISASFDDLLFEIGNKLERARNEICSPAETEIIDAVEELRKVVLMYINQMSRKG